MTTVKKAFQPLIDFLEANADKKVKSILAEVIELTKAQTTRMEGSSFIKDATGTVVAIHDYYFKRWMPLVGPSAVDFGQKLKSATGLNTMCKEGVSNWTKQQREAKNGLASLLSKVASGELAPADIAVEQAKLEEARKAIVPTELGFATQEEVEAYLAKLDVVSA